MSSHVRIYWVWPRRETDQPHIGFGAHHRLMVGLMAALLAPSVLLPCLLLADVDRFVMLMISLVSLFAQAMLLVPNLRYYRFYEVDAHASPLRKLGFQPPTAIAHRLPVRRGRFLAQQGNG